MLIIVLICIMKEVTTVNVAIGKSGTLCEKSKLTWKLFDGDTHAPQKIYFVKKFCSNQPVFISVELDSRFYVHYVIVNTGTTRNIGSLKYFGVSLMSDGKSFACSHFEKPLENLKAEDRMRVNCRTSNISISVVHLKILEQKDFEIAEIEVHSLGSGKKDEKLIFYRGCFKRIKSREVKPFESFDACWKRCHNRDFPLFAVKENMECHCGMNYELNEEVRLSKCSIVCEGTRRFCGGAGVLSVYLIKVQLPYYLGCSRDGGTTDILSTNITLAKCLKYCHDTTFIWLKKDRCGCLSREPKVEVSSASCKLPCSYDLEAMCGNINRFSIYGTCRRESARYLPCNKIFQCDGFTDKFGKCSSGCRPGFTGDYCIEKKSLFPERRKPSSTPYYVLIGVTVIILGCCLSKITTRKRKHTLHRHHT